jgi:hypothetical protein
MGGGKYIEEEVNATLISKDIQPFKKNYSMVAFLRAYFDPRLVTIPPVRGQAADSLL